MYIALAVYVLVTYIGVGIWAINSRGGPVALWAWFLSPVSAPMMILITLRDRSRSNKS